MVWYERRQNKYGAVRTVTRNGIFDSKKESAYCQDLELLKHARGPDKIKDYERQKTFELRGLNGKTICTHRVDYLVTLMDGTQEVHEVKSSITMTREWAIKRKLFEDNFPQIRYIVIR